MAYLKIIIGGGILEVLFLVREPSYKSLFVNLLKAYLENSTNLKQFIIWLNDNLILFDYKFYQLNILPSILGFYFLTDIKY